MLSARATRRCAGASALIGAALLVLMPFARSASADALETYDAQGIGRALELQFSFDPSIFSPLLQLGVGYSQSETSSLGGGTSYTLVSPTFPGTFAVGALGCFGGKGWIQAKYPATGGCGNHMHDNFTRFPREGNHPLVTTEPGSMTATATLGKSHGITTLGPTEVRAGNPDVPPFLTIDEIRTITDAARTPAGIQQSTTTIVRGIALDVEGASIRIDQLRSVASTSSDGTTGTADTTFTVGEVHAVVDGATYRARIDERGVHLDTPHLKRDVALSLERQLSAALDAAGIDVTVARGTRIVEDSAADASVGGLLLTLRGTVPPVQYPREVAPIMSQLIGAIPTICGYDHLPPPADLPLCFGPGVVPGPGTAAWATLAIGSVQSQVVGLRAFSFGPDNDGRSTDSDDWVPPVGPGPGVVIDPGFGSQPPTPPTSGDAVEPQQPGGVATLMGLVARMPSAALAATGAAFIVLAFALFLTPSLRP